MNEETQTSEIKDLSSLDEFQGWEQISTKDDFFNKSESDEKDESNKKDTIDEKTINQKRADKAEKITKTILGDDPDLKNDLFNSKEDIEQVKEEEIEEEKEEIFPNIATAKFLKDKGVLDFEEEEELTYEKAGELLEDIDEKFDTAVDNKIEELFDELPDTVKELNKYVIKGGDLNKFFSSINNTASSKITDSIDLSEESNQELVVREMLEKEDNDNEYIDTQLEFLKDSGKLEMFAQKKFDKWKKDKKAKQTALLKEQEENRKKQKESIKEAKQKVSSILSKTEEVSGLKFSKDDKKTLPSYMNDRTIKLQNGGSISRLQKELFYDLPQNEAAFIQLAVLMKNRNKDGTFNFESIIKNTETKVVKEVKENVRRSKTSIPTKSKSNKQKLNRSLADYFN